MKIPTLIAVVACFAAGFALLRPGSQKPTAKFENPDHRPAKTILAEAARKARDSDRNILVVVGASWCGACPIFWKSIHTATPWSIIDKNYVVTRINILDPQDENAGGTELVRAWSHGGPSGVPYYAILDSKLKVLADSEIMVDGRRADVPGLTGYAGDHFLEVLQKTGRHFTSKDRKDFEAWMFDPSGG